MNKQIEFTKDCGNSPKALIIKQLITALYQSDTQSLSQYLSNEVIWTLVGKGQMNGLEQISKSIASKEFSEIKKVTFENLITHGRLASINGRLEMKDSTVIEICNLYKFGSFGKDAKIVEIKSFQISA